MCSNLKWECFYVEMSQIYSHFKEYELQSEPEIVHCYTTCYTERSLSAFQICFSAIVSIFEGKTFLLKATSRVFFPLKKTTLSKDKMFATILKWKARWLKSTIEEKFLSFTLRCEKWKVNISFLPSLFRTKMLNSIQYQWTLFKYINTSCVYNNHEKLRDVTWFAKMIIENWANFFLQNHKKELFSTTLFSKIRWMILFYFI